MIFSTLAIIRTITSAEGLAEASISRGTIVKRIIFFGLVGGVLAATSGCGLCQAIFCYRPCVSCGGCGDCCDDEGGCGARPCLARPCACAPRCGPACGGCDTCCDAPCGRPCCAPCARSCGTCCGTCGDPCGDTCCNGCGDGCCQRCWHRGPLSCLFALFTPCSWCGCGCGGRYWGDFYSDPPDCWDPCDCHGNYMGCGCSTVCGSNGGCACHQGGGGCHNCGGGYSGGDPPATMSGEKMLSQTDRAVSPNSTTSQQPHRAARPQPEQQ
jgi:hypothetical protein